MNHLHNFAISLLAQDAVDPANESTGPISSFLALLGNDVFLALLTIALTCLLYTSPSPRDSNLSRMPSSA